MSTMNIMGTYSGITMDTIEQLIQAESGKVVKYTNEQTEARREQSAWKDVQTRLTNLSGKLSDLMKPESYESKKVTTSPEGKVSFTAGTAALSGDYTVTVSQLATRSHLAGEKHTLLKDQKLSDAWNQTGTLTLTSEKPGVDDTKKSIDILVEPEDSVESIVDRINERTKDSNISAVIIDNRIVLQSTELGDRTINVSSKVEEGKESLESLLKIDNKDIELGKPAELTVNGLSITRDSNHITDIMEGVTLELRDETTEPIQVKVTDDLDKATNTVKAFIDQYNSTLSFISDQLSVGDPSQENNKTGALSGDSSLMRLQSQLRSLLTAQVDNDNKDMNTAASIGIEVDRHGAATLDADKLKEVLREDSQKVLDLFSFTQTIEATEETEKVEKEVGLAQKFNILLNSFTNSKDGIIATKNETYDKMVKDLTTRIDTFNERLEVKRQQYIEKFTALDIAMMEAESQLGYLMSQIGANTGSNK